MTLGHPCRLAALILLSSLLFVPSAKSDFMHQIDNNPIVVASTQYYTKIPEIKTFAPPAQANNIRPLLSLGKKIIKFCKNPDGTSKCAKAWRNVSKHIQRTKACLAGEIPHPVTCKKNTPTGATVEEISEAIKKILRDHKPDEVPTDRINHLPNKVKAEQAKLADLRERIEVTNFAENWFARVRNIKKKVVRNIKKKVSVQSYRRWHPSRHDRTMQRLKRLRERKQRDEIFNDNY